MVADTGLGWNHPIAINLTDQYDSPLSGAVSSGGSLTVYGPGSATTAVHGPTTVTDLGNGDYGLTVPGSVLTTAGGYTWTIPTITVGGYTFIDQSGYFTVGLIPPEYRTLRTILVAVCEALGIGVRSVSTGSGSTTTLVDSRYLDAGIATNEFVGEELVLLEPAAATDAAAVRVTAFAPGSGTFTFAPAVTGMASGRDYLLLRPGTTGLRYAQVLEAIVAAVASLATRQAVTDEITLTTAWDVRTYTLPTTWLRVTRVEMAEGVGEDDPYFHEVMPSYYEERMERRHLFWTGPLLPQGLRLRLTGTVGVAEPRGLGDLVRVPWTEARDLAVAYLGTPPQQRAGLAFRRGTSARMRGR